MTKRDEVLSKIDQMSDDDLRRFAAGMLVEIHEQTRRAAQHSGWILALMVLSGLMGLIGFLLGV